MARKYGMSWNGTQRRWEKMVKGKRLFVACSTLAELYPPLPESEWNKEGSYQQANRWLAVQLGGNPNLSPADINRLDWARRNEPQLAPALEAAHKAGIPDDAEDVAYTRRFLEEQGWNIPEDADPAIISEILGNGRVWQDRLNRDTTAPHVASVSAAIDEYLAILQERKTKARTFKEIKDMLEPVREWFGNLSVEAMDESRVADAWKRIAAMKIEQNTKAKRWGFVKRFVTYLFETGRINLPRNLKSKLFSFKQQIKKLKTYPVEEVRIVLANLFRFATATANGTHISDEPASVLLYRFDLRGVVRGDDPMPVEPDLPAVWHRFGQLDIHDARPLPLSPQPRRRVEGPQILGPPRSQMFGNSPFDLSNQSGPGDADGCAWLYELSEVIQVQVIRPVVVKGVDAHDGVEEAGGKRQRPGIGVDREHAVLYPGILDALNVLCGANPQVGRPHLHAEFTSQENGRGCPPAAEVQDPHSGP
jgi:hypothetical protein